MFTTKTRDDGTTFVTLTDTAPEWLQTAVYDAHDGEMPNDWRYETCSRIWDAFTVEGIDPADDDQRFELADSLVDIYTFDLTTWLASHNDRQFYVDEARRAYGSEDQGVVWDIKAGQHYCISEMVGIMADAIVTAYDKYVQECEAEELEPHTLHMWAVHGCPTGPIG